jgi:hypothetical protein
MRTILITLIILLVGSALGYAVYPLTQRIFVDDPLPNLVEKSPEIVEVELKDTVANSVPDSISMAHLTNQQKTDMMRSLIKVNRQVRDSLNEDMPSVESSERAESDSTSNFSESLFPIQDTPFHPASGVVRVIDTIGDNTGAIIRFENYETINGPNLHVYLANDLNANDFVDLGEIRGTVGNINYFLPEEVDISQYRYVLVWCVPFGVLFHFAEIL